jgi:hypothetical protein
MTASARSITRRPVGALALLAALAITLTACSSAESDEPRSAAQAQSDVRTTDAASDPRTTASPRSFESAQHRYRIEVPADWTVVPGPGTWTSFHQFVPGTEVPGEDLASSASGSGWLVANSMLLPRGMTPDEWLAELDGLVGSGPSPDCREQRKTAVIAGEQATVVRHRCGDLTIVGSRLVHADRGYYFTVGYPTGDTVTESSLTALASSIRFTG